MKITVFLIIWGLFFFICLNTLDPDFGWHYKMGELILKSGIPYHDPFSYSMASFPFVDHEWLTNILLFFLYQRVGQFGLSILFSGIATLALFIHVPKRPPLFLPFAILSVGVLVGFIGVRPQLITWLLFSILVKIIFDTRLWKKFKILIPIYFVVWTNLHGGFAIGIVALFVYFLLQMVKTRKLIVEDQIIIILSLIATFINPYGLRIWWEVFMQITDSSLRFTVTEWMPIFVRFDPTYLLLAMLSCIFLFKYRKKFNTSQIGLFVFLFAMSLSSQRHAPLWVLIALPLTIKASEYFESNVSKIPQGTTRFKKAFIFLTILTFIFLGYQLFIYLGLVPRTGNEMYPSQAIQFLKTHPNERLFTPYNWGGYLIWKLPERKLFIDGRMPSWRWKSPNPYESDWAGKEYRNVVYENGDLSAFVKKYNIHQIAWNNPRSYRESPPITFLRKWNNGIFAKLLGLGQGINFYEKLDRLKWKKVYEDGTTIVYEK